MNGKKNEIQWQEMKKTCFFYYYLTFLLCNNSTDTYIFN